LFFELPHRLFIQAQQNTLFPLATFHRQHNKLDKTHASSKCNVALKLCVVLVFCIKVACEWIQKFSLRQKSKGPLLLEQDKHKNDVGPVETLPEDTLLVNQHKHNYVHRTTSKCLLIWCCCLMVKQNFLNWWTLIMWLGCGGDAWCMMWHIVIKKKVKLPWPYSCICTFIRMH